MSFYKYKPIFGTELYIYFLRIRISDIYYILIFSFHFNEYDMIELYAMMSYSLM